MIEHRHEEAFTPHGERNPYYPEPIVPDVIHHGPIHVHFSPKPRTVTVEENIKLAEIKDAFKNLRYKVSMTSFDSCYIPRKKEYQILVITYNGLQNPIVLINRPSTGQRKIYDYDEALKIYEHYVAHYTYLVKAETAECQDIALYKELVGYKLTTPKCCFTCKWCKKQPIEVDFLIGHIGHLECWNPKSCQAYNFESEHRHGPWNEHCHNPCINNDPYMCHDPHILNDLKHDRMYLDIHPAVEILGVCDNYEKFNGELQPYPNQIIKH